jgi:hypothetical protein
VRRFENLGRSSRMHRSGLRFLQAIGEAFAVGWLEIADHYDNTQAERETARVKLATALLSVATGDTHDPQALKTAALVRMKASYRYL